MGLQELYLKLISPQEGGGPSTTKWVYLHAGALSIYSAALATVGGVMVYLVFQKADGVYWAATGGLWINCLGFASTVKKHAASATKEVIIAKSSKASEAKVAAPPEGGTP